MKAFLLDVSPPPSGMGELHELLLRHQAIRDVFSEIPYSYLLKTGDDMEAESLADLVACVIPGVAFFVAGLHPGKIAGFISDRARQWIEAPAPPRRHDAHQPDQDAIKRLPDPAILEYSQQQARLAALIAAPVKGEA